MYFWGTLIFFTLGYPINGIFVTIDKAFQDEITTPSGFKLWLDGSYNKNFTATVTGRVAALPVKAKSPSQEKILRELSIGDEIAFSYQVVFDLDYVSDGNQFMPVTENNDRARKWISGDGEKLFVDCIRNQKTWSDIWIGYYLNKYNQHVDGVQGSQEDVERWLSQFPIGKTDRYVHSNLFNFNGKDYWRCELSKILAKKVNGNPVALSNRVICSPIEEPMPVEFKIQVASLTDDVKIRYQDRGKIISGHTNIRGLKRNDTIMFPDRFVEKYELWGKEYYLVNKNFVHSKL